MLLVLYSYVTRLVFTRTKSFEKFINDVRFILLMHIMIFTPFSDLVLMVRLVLPC